MPTAQDIASVQLIVGLEVHVELATRTKMFSRSPSPACPEFDGASPNSLIDPTVLALPGALPVMNKSAVEMAMMVGLALNCTIAGSTKWDRKSYFYPDLPKSYQISQYDLPLCFDGAVELPAVDEKGFPDPLGEPCRIGIIRAHLEEDAGKLLHEAPGGGHIDFSIVDLNRAGTPLLEIVTQPDFRSAEDVVLFAKMLRNICRFLGVSEGVMQKGHMRFEPNINTRITMNDGHFVDTPIVEIKNLNSFKALKGAVEFEMADQPRRWLEDHRVMGKGMKVTRGWDDARGVTVVQREKEDAHDYRYFPDPDLTPVLVDDAWRESVKARVPELPMARFGRYVKDYGVGVKEAFALVEERDACLFYETTIEELILRGLDRARAGKLAANILLQSGAKRANEQGRTIDQLGITPQSVAAIGKLREDGKLGTQAVDELFGLLSLPAAGRAGAGLAEPSESLDAKVESLAKEKGLLIIRDDAAMEKWVDQVIAANEKVAADVRGGKVAAAGRLVGEVMKLAGGAADAKAVREMILKKLS
jgi:aspartyl-tRNA(Asn)/glutamyl-tRNA(Gln) amidotransferase subunit B